MATRKPYPSDVSDEEWAFVAPYLALVREDAPQRNHDLREVFNGLRWIVRTGSAWRYMPHDLPPWEAVYQQTRRWLEAGVFEEMVHDLRVLLRLLGGRAPDPTATILDSRTLQSTPESGSRGGYDGAKRKKGTKVHAAVDTLGHLLALHLTPANEQEREHVGKLAEMLRSPPSSPSPCWCWCCVGWQRLRRRALGSFGVSSEPDRSRRTRLIHSTS
jgi:transposase